MQGNKGFANVHEDEKGLQVEKSMKQVSIQGGAQTFLTNSIDRVDKTSCTKFSSVKPLQPHISLVSKFSLLFCIISYGTHRENLSNNQDLLILMTLMFNSG